MTRILILFALTVSFACEKERKLPILGRKEAVVKLVDGQEVTDTIYQTVPKFTYTNQDGQVVTNNTVSGKIYTADFFFTTCTTICPIGKRNMLKLQEAYKDDDRILFLSHSLDPVHDTPAVLKDYAQKLGADTKQWIFLRGDREKTFELANEYLIAAVPDSTAPDGINHSGNIMLIDTEGRMRGFYNGLTEEGIDQLIADIKILMDEEFN